MWKTIRERAILAVAAAALPTLAAGLGPEEAPAQERRGHGASESPATLEVSGSADISVPSDRARIALAVETQAESAGEASQENARLASAVMEAVEALDIDGLEVETRGYRLQPQYERPESGRQEPPEVVAYRATNQVVVTIDDVDATGQVVDTGVEAGANRVGSLEFDLRDREPAREEALREAVRKARQEAGIIADAMEVELGPVKEVRSDPERTGVRLRAMEADVVASPQAEAAPTPVEPGDVEVSAAVQVIFTLDP